MPIPPLSADGRLPPGVHRATPEEVVSRFCAGSERRLGLRDPFLTLVEVAREAKASEQIIDGSFVTSKERPGDIDAILVLPRGFDIRSECGKQIKELYEVHGFDVERVSEGDAELRDYLVNVFFGTDRDGNHRGLVEVIL